MMPDTYSQYDLFISYGRGDDINFTVKLVSDLTKYGYRVWFDKQDLESNGLSFLQSIRDSLATNPMRFILIVGPHSSKSNYVRYEWEFALANCMVIIPILRMGSERDENGFPKMSDKDYDYIPESISKRNLDCIDFRRERKYVHALNELLNDLSKEIKKLTELHGVINKPNNYICRENELEKIKNSILKDTLSPTVVTSTGKVTSLQGMGGIGKSVIAAAVCYDCDIRRSFQDGIFWVTLGQHPVIQSAVTYITKDNTINITNREGKDKFHNFLKDKNCLIILDDVWEQEHIEIFPSDIALRCRLLITTRNKKTVRHLSQEIIEIGLLDNEDALLLLSKASNKIKMELPIEALEIITECGNLPLAISMIGGMIKAGDEASWKYSLQMLQGADLKEISEKFPDYPYPDLYKAISVSFYDLSEAKRSKYLQLGIFKEDARIPEEIINLLWETEDWKEYQTHTLINEFVDRGLLQRTSSSIYAIHDLLFDFIRKTSVDTISAHNQLLKNLGDPLKLSHLYAWNNYIWHLLEARQTVTAANLILDFKWIQVKLKHTDIYSLLSDVLQITKKDKRFQNLYAILSSCQNIIAEDFSQLRTQLIGRINCNDTLLKPLLESTINHEGENYARPLFKCFENKPPDSIDWSFNNISSVFCVSLDESLLAITTTVKNIEVWNWKEGKLLASYRIESYITEIIFLQFLNNKEHLIFVDSSGQSYILTWTNMFIKCFSNLIFNRDMSPFQKKEGLVLTKDRKHFFINIGDKILIYELNSLNLLHKIEPKDKEIDNLHLSEIDSIIFFTCGDSYSNVYAWDWKTNVELNKLCGKIGEDNAFLKLQNTIDNYLIIRLFPSYYICWDDQIEISSSNSWSLEENSDEYKLIKNDDRFQKTRGDSFEKFIFWNWKSKNDETIVVHKGFKFLPYHSFFLITCIPENNIVFKREANFAKEVEVIDLEFPENTYTLPGNGNRIKQMCLSQDKKYLVTGDIEGNVTVWDWEKKIIVSQKKLIEAAIEYLYFSDGGIYIIFSEAISSSIKIIKFEELFTDNFQHIEIPLIGKPFDPLALHITKDDKYLFFRSETSLYVKRIIDLYQTGQEQRYNYINEFKIFIDAGLLSTISYNKVTFFDAASGINNRLIAINDLMVTFSKDLKFMFTFYAGNILVYNIKDISIIKNISVEILLFEERINYILLSSDESIVYLVCREKVFGWKVEKGDLCMNFELSSDIEGNIAFASLILNNTTLLFSTDREEIYLWNIVEKKFYSCRGIGFKEYFKEKQFLPRSMNTKNYSLIAVSSSTDIIYTDFENTIFYWDCEGLLSELLNKNKVSFFYKYGNSLRGHSSRGLTGGIGRMEFTENEDYLFSISNQGQIAIWNWNEKSLFKIKDFQIRDSSTGLICITNHFLAIPEKDYSIKLWFWKDNIVHDLWGHKNTIRQILYVSELNYLISTSEDKIIKLWKLNNSNMPILKMNIAMDDICLVTFDPIKHHLYACGMKGKIYSFIIE